MHKSGRFIFQDGVSHRLFSGAFRYSWYIQIWFYIIGGILVGTSRTVAAEFTFFLGIPVMFGASLLKIVKFGFGFTGTEVLILVIGMVVAFVVSILAIKFLMGYYQET